MHAVRNSQLLTFRCPRTSLPAVCRIHFSITSVRCWLLSFCYITDAWHGKQKSVTVQCKVRRYYESPSRQQKNEGEKNLSAFHAESPSLHLYTLPSAVPLQNISRRRWSVMTLTSQVCINIICNRNFENPARAWSSSELFLVHTAVMGSTVKFLSLVTLIIVITDHDMVLCQNEWKREADGANSSEYIYMY